MTAPRSEEAEDRFVELALEEELSGRGPPDLCAGLRAASPETRARAARAVEAAAAAATPRSKGWTVAVAALLVGCLGLLGLWILTSRRPEARTPQSGQPVASSDVEDRLLPGDRATALLDQFHRVMPREPVELRDRSSRERHAPLAIPVVRELTSFAAAHPADCAYADRVLEFTIYALVLGDDQTRAQVGERAATGDASAQLMLRTAAAITADPGSEREAAIGLLADQLRTECPATTSAVNCLATTADLSEPEAARLGQALADLRLTRRLLTAARTGASHPRRLLDRPLALAGRLHTGEQFSTASLRGKVVVVWFWASWCRPCFDVLPEVVTIQEKYAARGLQVVGVSCDNDLPALAKCLAEDSRLTWPQLFDSRQPGWHELAIACGVMSIPRLFLIDRQGIVRSVNAAEHVDQLVQKLLRD
jgi:thiol-disulfide isomerase/thioredoxin